MSAGAPPAFNLKSALAHPEFANKLHAANANKQSALRGTDERDRRSTYNRFVGACDWDPGNGRRTSLLQYAGASPAWNVLTRNLLGLISLALLIVFVTGLPEILRQADSRYQWVAGLVQGTGLIFVTVSL